MANNRIFILCLFIISIILQLGDCQLNDFVNKYFTAAEEPKESGEWHGKWFPKRPRTSLPTDHDLYDPKHGVQMGVPSAECDTGLMNLTIDWDYNSADFTCYDNELLYAPRFDVFPISHRDHIPKSYSAAHECMNANITYTDLIPTFGTHRPLWAKYGEYRYLPKQRWIHNLEHGSIVMLYHPCANKQEIKLLKGLVVNCLYRHVITPFRWLSPERPFALVAWGSRLLMSKIDPDIVVDFIRENALKGPEQVSRDGQFEQQLLRHAEVVTTIDDEKLCPRF
ncbi:uncharacterized protein LOC123296931 [Chrysoperla carnea]|uniref:uncharacterized protein LOC123296931 n=1 Tax=Chrysoperla carnea TaxID=189513 RepID=UPI001D0717B6|nr:uncharacterized protein LOC123296931 [Chrysoperla carnea]